MKKPYRTAVIGKGRWGQKIIATLEKLPEAVIAYIETHNYYKLIAKKDIDAVIVATPASVHAQIALPFIKRGLPVFIEKPVTTSLVDAKNLELAAQKSGSLIFVGHIHLYNPVYKKVKELVKKIGRIRFLYGEGCNNGPYRNDISAMWDWAPHDIAIMIDLVGSKPVYVQAWGTSSLRPETKLHDVSYIKLNFPKELTGFIFSSWLFPDKRKRITIVGEKNSIVFDDVAEQKIILYKDMGPVLKKNKDTLEVLRKESKIIHPAYTKEMPLTLELKAFFQNISGKEKPKTDINQGIAVVEVLEAAEESIARGGRLSQLKNK
ncbi:MAG: hypothetical protein A2913_02110 [Parcubacteria group bacterium RIFCSPLOWO2_01_FULL_40_65]|nr:MAG: hypothetical protein A2734_01310 [Parcubacteria group bacterium RIFCSPHIGHO2_01_FULL_40_30]OHB19522.1 MAG: hypothetical protein A3D40_02680 [Parcubacteria group bacterium RIFCSPHIGHO2_02_FULL_40_12]OHB21463.1 MAG: hypothetical protein A2913_02110 [Parcubacteria group bacterium RIFCSPLOWO2_01_FULL_40_65]OHB22973.1 MAG: hypothetical protein A3I22_00875 [Parcubacteria group bacterium RIFCSPLOWO2_02_FULL_40_12]OHB24416.1 MAG: hypothetical protein A3F96_00895 [Parcubacteria group bacterium R